MSDVVRGAKVTRKSRQTTQPQAASADPSGPTPADASSTAPSVVGVDGAVSASSAPGVAVASPLPAAPSTATGATAVATSAAGAPRSPAPSVAAAGTRAWINGLTLASTGVQQLDQLFGGGVPLSTLVLLKEDMYGSGASTFAASFIADGVSYGQRTLVVSGAPGGRAALSVWIANALPRNVVLEREAAREADAAAAATAAATAAAAAQSAPSGSNGDDLKIAWRYQQYLERPQDARANLGAHKQAGGGGSSSGGSSTSAPAGPSSSSRPSTTTLSYSYDYASSMSSTLLASNPPALLHVQEDITAASSRAALDSTAAPASASDPGLAQRLMYRNVLRAIASFLDSHGCAPLAPGGVPSGPVCRIVLQSLGSLGWAADDMAHGGGGGGGEGHTDALLLFLAHLRQLLWQRRALVLATVPGALFPASAMRCMAHTAHAALSLQSFAAAGGAGAAVAQHALGDYDGILRLEKAPSLHSLQPAVTVAGAVAAPDSAASGSASAAAAAGNAASSSCFLYKCAHRKIVIDKFALPPEAEEDALTGAPPDSLQMEQAHRAPKPASVRSARPPPPPQPSTSASAAAGAAGAPRARIELGLDSDEQDGAALDDAESRGGLFAGAGALSRRPGAESSAAPDPRRARALAQNDTLQGIVRGRATGCSGGHNLPGKMDF